jgi:hypothetical protein
VSDGASGEVENMSTRGLYPVSPIAKYRPLGENETHVAAFILSLTFQLLFPGESDHSMAGDASGEALMPASRRVAAVRLRLSFCVGVEGPP